MKSLKIKNIRNYTLIFLGGLLLGWIFFHNGKEAKLAADNHTEGSISEEGHSHDEASIWTCSMHPQIKRDKPGKCPICSMDLIPLNKMESNADKTDPNEISMMPSAAKLADIQTATVGKGKAEKELHLQGKIQPDERNIAQITARYGGRIEKLFINYTGQSVVRGAKLATIYSPELVSAQKELLEALKMKSGNPAIYESAFNKLKLWDLTDAQIHSIEEAGAPREYFDVLAPISGTVTMRMVAVGDYVKQGMSMFQVMDLSKVWLLMDAYESDLPWLHVGDEVSFGVSSLPGETFKGKISFIDPMLDARTRVSHLRVELLNRNSKLKPEMFADAVVKSKLSSGNSDMIIPASAVLWTGKRSVVYVKVPERDYPTFLYREVVLGPKTSDGFVVKEGLKEGEEIAVNGVFKIDAAAQLEGKQSMMQPKTDEKSGSSSTHNHGSMSENQGSKSENQGSMKEMGSTKMVMIQVSGNCEMCKERIEGAVKKMAGVKSVEWNADTKMAHLNIDPSKVSETNLHKAFAAAGHDTKLVKASDKVYKELPECCNYRDSK